MIGKAQPNKTHALVVGIETYPGNADWNLPGAAKSASDFARWLRGQGVPADNILLFLSPLPGAGAKVEGIVPKEPNHGQIWEAVDVILPNLDSGELLFLFWAGHGQMDFNHQLRLYYADSANGGASLNLGWLSMRLRTRDFKSFSWHIGFIDSCADYAKVNYNEEVSLDKPPIFDRKQFFLFATQPGQQAQASLFSQCLLEELGKGPKNVWPDLQDLTSRVKRRLSDTPDQTPNLSIIDWDENSVELSPVSTPRPPNYSITRLPLTETKLFGRDDELRMLDQCWNSLKTKVLTIWAWGGVGKSSLVGYWLRTIHDGCPPGCKRVYGWSFSSRDPSDYEQASAGPFFDAALRWFQDEDPQRGGPWERGERLAKLIQDQRTCLVLDGLESLQYPPRSRRAGQLKDEGLKALLSGLVARNSGLCIITTRLPIADLESVEGANEECPVLRKELMHFTEEAGADLLEFRGVKGERDELLDAARECEKHSLALSLLGPVLSVKT